MLKCVCSVLIIFASVSSFFVVVPRPNPFSLPQRAEGALSNLNHKEKR
jgi:hypothetical protein